jgi:hypothetical protein
MTYFIKRRAYSAYAAQGMKHSEIVAHINQTFGLLGKIDRLRVV